jgi:hypothetical protein
MADHQMIVHVDLERAGSGDDLARDGNVGARGRGICFSCATGAVTAPSNEPNLRISSLAIGLTSRRGMTNSTSSRIS